MFVSFRGTTAGFPYPSDQAFIILSHPSVSDVLVLSQFDSEPYSRTLQGFPQSDGRSLMGSLKISGGSYIPVPEWDLNLLIKPPQLVLFESLLNAQRIGPVTLQDGFTRGDASTVWLDVDDRYATPNGSLLVYKLQFRAKKQ